MRHIFSITALLTLTLIPCHGAEEGKRVALVIGNDAYIQRPLQNAVNDARLMQKALTGAGFRVILRENADKVAMESAAAEFLDSIGPSDTALFFYAGHAVQIENENVLIPVDFASRTVIEARFRSFSLGMVYETLQRARAKTSIVIIDACRTNPVTAGQQAGLATPQTKNRELYTAFSTSPNNVAADNPDGKNSWFTEALADSITKPGLTLDDVFTRVRLRVESATGGAQIPWSQTSLTKKFYLHPPVTSEVENDLTVADKWLTDALKHEQYGNWPEAADLLNRIVKQKPGGVTEQTAIAHLPYVSARNEAALKFEAGDFKRAAEEYEKALQLEPFDTDAAFELANNALLSEDLPRAVKALESVRERGRVAALARADAMLKEIGKVEPSALALLRNGPPQPPSIQQVFRTHRFGAPDLQAGYRLARQIAPVDYAAVAKAIPPPPPPAAPVVAVGTPPPAAPTAPGATPSGEPPFDLEALHVEVKSLVASRDLVTEEFGEVVIAADKPHLAVLLDGKPVTRSLPFTMKLPAGKYEIRSIASGKTLLERQVEVKSGETVQLMLK